MINKLPVQVANDMQKMKDGHVQVVGKIEGAHRYIKDESQVRFFIFFVFLKNCFSVMGSLLMQLFT